MISLEINKAVSVAYGLAGAATKVKSPFGVFSNCVNDRPTDRQTDQPTVTYSRVHATKNYPDS